MEAILRSRGGYTLFRGGYTQFRGGYTRFRGGYTQHCGNKVNSQVMFYITLCDFTGSLFIEMSKTNLSPFVCSSDPFSKTCYYWQFTSILHFTFICANFIANDQGWGQTHLYSYTKQNM